MIWKIADAAAYRQLAAAGGAKNGSNAADRPAADAVTTMVVRNLSPADFTMAFQLAWSNAAAMTTAKTVSDMELKASRAGWRSLRALLFQNSMEGRSAGSACAILHAVSCAEQKGVTSPRCALCRGGAQLTGQ